MWINYVVTGLKRPISLMLWKHLMKNDMNRARKVNGLIAVSRAIPTEMGN